MINKKGFLLACSLALMISFNNCMFLKSNEPVEKATLNFDCPAIVKETIEAMQPNLKGIVKQTITPSTKDTTAPATETSKAPAEAQEEGAGIEKETETPAAEGAVGQGTQQPSAPAAPAAECAPGAQGSADYKNNLKDLQAQLEEQINILNSQQQEAQKNINQLEAKETQNLINTVNQKEKEVLGTGAVSAACTAQAAQPTPYAAPEANATSAPKAEAPVLTKQSTPSQAEKGCNIKQQNLIQVDGVDAIEKFGDVLNFKGISPPTIANSISTSTSIAKGKADDNSVANTVQNVKSTTTAEAEGQQNAIAVANVVGKTEAKSDNLAVDNARAVTVVNDLNNGTAKANATENSLATANVKNDQKSETNTVAGANSTAISGTEMTSNTQSTANAAQGSIADTKAISDEKSTTNTGAALNSTAIGVTAVNTDTASLADAANKSLAQSVAESQNAAKTTTVALDNSAAVGATKLDSNSNSTALATNGGNALSTSDAKSCVATESIANNNSVSVVQNNGGSQSNATSVSNGIAGPYENPLQTGNAPSDNTTGISLQQGSGKEASDCSVKIPSILDTATKVTLKSEEGTSNIRDKVKAEKESCGSLEEHKTDVLEAAKDTTLKSGAAEDTEAQKTKEKEECDSLKAEDRRLRDQNKKLKRERKAKEKRQRKSRKYKSGSKRRTDRAMDSDASEMSAPRVRSSSSRMYGDCELNKKVSKDFQESLEEESKPDERFNEKNMFRDNIKEYDARSNDERVNDDCTDICKKEKLGSFVSSEIQDIMRGNFLFKCDCQQGTTDWYMYDSKTDKSRPLSSSSGILLGERVPISFCDDMPLPRTEAIEGGNATPAPALQGGAALAAQRPILAASCDDSAEAEEEDEDRDDDSRCGNFVSQRIDAAKRRAKGGADEKMHSDLGECFNNFISDKFNKLHRRLNKIKSKHTNYVKDLHKKQLRKQAAKVEDIVDKSAENVNGPEFSGANACEPLRGGDNLRNIQANMNDLKRDLKLNTSARKDTPEDVYFQARNAKDDDRFNQRLQSRFDDKTKCEDDRFSNRFGNNNRYTARDDGAKADTKKAIPLKSDSGAFISAEVGRIKDQNQNYLGKIKNMFGGCE